MKRITFLYFAHLWHIYTHLKFPYMNSLWSQRYINTSSNRLNKGLSRALDCWHWHSISISMHSNRHTVSRKLEQWGWIYTAMGSMVKFPLVRRLTSCGFPYKILASDRWMHVPECPPTCIHFIAVAVYSFQGNGSDMLPPPKKCNACFFVFWNQLFAQCIFFF